MPTSKIALGELVLDWDLYPRSQVSSEHVTHLAESLEAGGTFPPIVADKASKRITDGFHRYRMYQKVLAPEEKIPVELIAYASDDEMLRDTLRRNNSHGRPFSNFDRARAIALAERFGISVEAIASDLGITTEVVSSLKDARRAYGAKDKPIVLKNSIAAKMRGRTLTQAQVEANARLDGMRPLYHINQIIIVLEHDMVEWNEAFTERALVLQRLLEEQLGKEDAA